jgi:hypothetical protein
MDPENKLGSSLAAANLIGAVTATSFYLLGDILTGLIGFLAGFFGTVLMIYLKHENQRAS